MVAHHVAGRPARHRLRFLRRPQPRLLDKRLLAQHYSARVLASPAARTSWVEPDRTPFPWTA